MDRNREARRVAVATSNGLPRRRHRTSSIRDSPEDDGALELQETARFRDRTGKRDRDRDKERSERDRPERDRERDRLSRSKRRRGDKYMHGSNREDGVDDSSEESIDDEDEDPEDGPPLRFMPPNPAMVSSSSSPSSALTSHRKSYPPPSKVFKVVPTWKAADEMIGFTIPRKARSASTKRPHSAVVAEQFLQQIYSSPVRPPMAGSSTVASPSAAPMSPSSSSLSMKKKIKPNGPKQRPPKSSTQSPSSIQDDIEIEVAEVLYGLMRQSHGPSKQEDSARYDSREVNRSTGDSKSRASSPASHSTSVPAQDSSGIPQNCNPSAPPLCAVAPKRKRPRLVSQLEENQTCLASRSNLVSIAPKMAPDLLAKQEIHSQNPGKNSDTRAENGGATSDLVKSHGAELNREAVRLEPSCAVPSSEEKRFPVLDQSEGKDTVMAGKLKEVPSPKKEPLDDRVDYTSLQQSVSNLMITSTTAGEKEIRREEKLEIDLMAPPPQSRSPEREGVINHPLESMAPYGEAEVKSKQSEVMEAGRAAGAGVNTDLNTEAVEKGSNFSVSGAKEGEPHKANVNNKAKNIDLHLDLERSAAPSGGEDHKLNNHHLQKQQPLQELKSSRDDNSIDKTAQTSSIALSMSVPTGWPAGLPPMGYVAPLQGMVSMDGRPMAPTAIQPPHFLFTQPRPGRCATHCYIAKNIFSHHQFMKNYPFWPAAAGASPLFGAKPYNLNLVPATDLHASAAVRSDAHPVQDKGQTFAFFPGQQPAVKDKGSQPTTNVADGAQKKQLYQSLPPGGPNNMMHGPATLFFPMGQQQAAAAAASSHGKSTKSGPVQAGITASASMSTSVHNASAPTGQASQATMSFTYPNVPANDTQYLAILANGGAYPFPVPTHVGAAQAYRGGAHPQVMPFYNSQYYPSQIIHPSQVQQHQQAPPPSSQPVQIQSSHQNPNISTASSSSQKHSQNQQQRPQGNNPNGVTTNPGLQNFPIPKSRASQTQQQHEMGGEGSPSTADSRMSRPPPNMSVYGQSFAMPFNPSNFALMTSPATTGGSTNGSHSEKKQQPHGQQLQQAMAPQAFAMSFASMNGATPPGLDLTSMEHNHAIFQSLPEAARNNYHIMAAAAAAQAVQQKKNYHGSGDSKSGAPGSSNADDERKGTGVKSSTALTGQSIAFSRPDLAETSVTTVSGNNVVDSSARSLNLVPGSVRSSRSSAPNAMSNSTSSGSQQQQQQQQQQHQQFIQLQRQQQYAAAAAAQNKGPVTSNGSVYSDHLSASSAVTAKFPNSLSGFPPSMVQGNSPGQSQWKNSGRTLPSQGSSPSTTSNTTSMKSHGQQGRPQSGHTQISFGGNNTKPSNASQGQQIPNVTQSQSPPMMVGSPSTSSVSKGHSGSPRMTPSSSIGNNKQAQASSLSTQQGKNSPSIPSQKSSPVTGSGRNVPSVFGNSHMPVSSSVGSNKPQLQQPQLSKQSIQQAQMFFGGPYVQTSHPHSTTSSSAASSVGGFQLQRHRQDQQQQQQQHQPMPKSQGGPTPTASSGTLSLSPLPANANTNDPTKAIKGGVFHAAQFAAQASGAAHTMVSAGFPYIHAVPAAAAVQVKPADQQKQPAGNDNMAGCWQPEKK